MEKSDTSIPFSTLPNSLSKLLSTSDGLFFIRYTPENNFKQRWFLVQFNHVETTILNIQPETTCDYHVTLLARHPDDKHMCDDKHEGDLNDTSVSWTTTTFQCIDLAY